MQAVPDAAGDGQGGQGAGLVDELEGELAVGLEDEVLGLLLDAAEEVGGRPVDAGADRHPAGVGPLRLLGRLRLRRRSRRGSRCGAGCRRCGLGPGGAGQRQAERGGQRQRAPDATAGQTAGVLRACPILVHSASSGRS